MTNTLKDRRVFDRADKLVGHYPNGNRLNHRNHRRLWPLVGLGDDKFDLEDGWTIVGCCKAPYGSGYGYGDALVLEFWGDEDEDNCGLHWMHCDLTKIKLPNKPHHLPETETGDKQ